MHIIKPFFSIIIPTYNRALFIEGVIESVLSQSYKNWELIIVDDGSTDKTKEIIASFTDLRIKYFYQENAERSVARNNGIRKASGEYVIFLDSDDELYPDFLEELNLEIKSKGSEKALYFYHVIKKVNGKEKTLGLMPETENALQELFLKNTVIQVSQAAIHKSVFDNCYFDDRLSLWEDTHFYFRCLCFFKLVNCDLKGIKMNSHNNSTVEIGMQHVKMFDVNRYMEAIVDLEKNHFSEFLAKGISKQHFKNYKDAKLHMYFYQARVNKQYRVAYQIGCKLLKNKFSIMNLFTVFKLPIHGIIRLFK